MCWYVWWLELFVKIVKGYKKIINEIKYHFLVRLAPALLAFRKSAWSINQSHPLATPRGEATQILHKKGFKGPWTFSGGVGLDLSIGPQRGGSVLTGIWIKLFPCKVAFYAYMHGKTLFAVTLLANAKQGIWKIWGIHLVFCKPFPKTSFPLFLPTIHFALYSIASYFFYFLFFIPEMPTETPGSGRGWHTQESLSLSHLVIPHWTFPLRALRSCLFSFFPFSFPSFPAGGHLGGLPVRGGVGRTEEKWTGLGGLGEWSQKKPHNYTTVPWGKILLWGDKPTCFNVNTLLPGWVILYFIFILFYFVSRLYWFYKQSKAMNVSNMILPPSIYPHSNINAK